MPGIPIAGPVAGPVAGVVVRPVPVLDTGFLPPQLATLTSWHNAADTRTSSIVSSGGDVSDWLDQSGNGNHLTQGVGANQPTTGVETQNGLNLIAFDGTAHYLQETGTSNIADVILGDHTIFFVGEVAAALDETQCLLGWNDVSGTPNHELFCYGSSDEALNVLSIAPTTAITSSLGAIPAVVTLAVDHSANLVTRVNGVETSDLAITGSAVSGMFTFCAELDSGPNVGNFVDGNYGELIIYGRLLPSDEIAQVEAYAADKWGVVPL